MQAAIRELIGRQDVTLVRTLGLCVEFIFKIPDHKSNTQVIRDMLTRTRAQTQAALVPPWTPETNAFKLWP
eukprot:2373173-Prorocentrum_lima.AAC.1